MSDDFPPESPTGVPCPARCESGKRVSRLETKSGHVIRSTTCAYCAGTGVVTLARSLAYKLLAKDGIPPDPECD